MMVTTAANAQSNVVPHFPQPLPVVCTQNEITKSQWIENMIAKKYKESLIMSGTKENAPVAFHFYGNPDTGTWTIVTIFHNTNTMCLINSGINLQFHTYKQPGEDL